MPNRFAGWLPSSMLLKIVSIKPPIENIGENMMYWGCSKSGKFIVKSAFNFMKSNQWDEENIKWNYIWRWWGPERVKTFLWLAMHHRLLTNGERMYRRLSSHDCCSKCQSREDTLHVLTDWPIALHIWNSLVHQQDWKKFFFKHPFGVVAS